MYDSRAISRGMLRLVCTTWLIMFSSAQDGCRRYFDVTHGCEHTYGNELKTLTNIRSVLECSSQCNDNDRCLSVKYDMDRHVCKLNSVRYSSFSTNCPVRFKYAELSKSSCWKGINDDCTESNECLVNVPNSQCFNGKCQCDPGYSYQKNNESCVTSCEEYGSTFTVYLGFYLPGYNDKAVNYVNGVESCEQLCDEETSFVCRSIDFHPYKNVCSLSSTTVLIESTSLYQQSDTNYSHHQRNCQ